MDSGHGIDISTKLAGVRMRTPFGVSPHNLDKPWFPGKKAAECFMKYVDAGAGFVYLPAIVPGEPSEAEKALDFATLHKNQQYVGRWLKVKEGRNVIAHLYTAKNLFNNFQWAKELVEELRPQLPEGVAIIGQILVHDVDPKKWADHAKHIEDLGVDLIELNTGCPLGAMSSIDARKMPPEAKWGMMMGTAPEFLFPVMEAVAGAVTVPVGFKLSPEAGYPRMMYIVEEMAKRGAKYVVTTHKYFAVAPPDIYNCGRGRFPAIANGANCLADIGGAALRFSMYKATGLISKNIPEIECFAGGGITQPEHLAEAIMLGAQACQTLTGIVTGGIGFLTRANQWLKKYMAEQGFQSLEDFRGMGLKYLAGAGDVEFLYYKAQINREKCNNCGKCSQSYCPAISMRDGEPYVDEKYCSCCAMCAVICPNDAIEYVDRG